MANTTDPQKHERSNPPSHPGQAGAAPSGRVADATSSLGEMVHDAASGVAHAAEGAASYVGKKAQGAAAAVSGGVHAAGSAVREHVPRSLENTGLYLRAEGFTGIAKDVTNLVRRHPFPAVLAGVGVGFLLCRLTTRRG